MPYIVGLWLYNRRQPYVRMMKNLLKRIHLRKNKKTMTQWLKLLILAISFYRTFLIHKGCFVHEKLKAFISFLDTLRNCSQGVVSRCNCSLIFLILYRNKKRQEQSFFKCCTYHSWLNIIHSWRKMDYFLAYYVQH